MNPLRKTVIGGAIVASTLAGGALGAALVNGSAVAQESTTTTTPNSSDSSTTANQSSFDPSKGGHVGENGVTEELLTGDTAEKVKAAALAAVPGGTIQRVETDAEGATYEAHMLDADGNPVIVKLDESFKVTGTETGGPGGHGPGRPAAGQSTDESTSA